ncbi:hypothetical protein [Agrococcus sp. BE272]|uniref:hypothetical protein n=1 Tax=Agrococcus sp. BE272 TaxID=2817727 RepID=UPI00286778ED|nr:hypothetical protein [Agrococcus sp. BE272]MDR7234865.1 hypothetical protein [Agrococcus sp. BE272]
MSARTARGAQGALLVALALLTTGCVILPPPLPTAAPPVVATPTATPSASSTAEPTPTPTATEAAPSEPAPSEPQPTAEECAAADQALAAIVERATEVLDAVPAEGSPDWAAADAVVADLPVMRDAFIAETTSPALAESFRELDQPIADLTEAVASRNDLSVTILSPIVALAAPSALLPCAGVL